MKKRKSNNRGFTLLELIISLAITGLILVVLASSMMLSWRSEEKASEREELSERIRIITQRLTWLIRGAYPFLKATPEGKTLYFEGTEDTLGLVTTSVIRESDDLINSPGLKWIKLYPEEDRLMVREKLFYEKDIFEDDGGKTYTIADDIYEIGFEYLDRDNKEGEEEWVNEWDPKDKDYLPALVKISLKIT
ncbi:MAG: prepilin-type N-terminal cleavage/methylation domain-containing protein, partial [Nitrospirae bacterium]